MSFLKTLRVHPAICAAYAAILSAALAFSPPPAATAGAKVRGAPENRVSEAARQVYRLLVETANGSILGGSAFLVSGSRIIATNHHVIAGGVVYYVGLLDGDGPVKRIPARLLASFPQKDLALLQALDDLPGEPLSLDGRYPALAQELYAIGFPAAADLHDGVTGPPYADALFFTPSVLKGYVSRVLAHRWFRSQLQHQTPIVPGYSGGPLISPDGAVVGVSTSIHKEASGISYGVLAADLLDLLNACGLPASVRSRSPHLNLKALALAGRSDAHPAEPLSPDADLSLQVSDEMIARGNALLDQGDIAAARLMFEYLANYLHSPEIYIGLAKSYDPDFLQREGIIGIAGDPAKSQQYYKTAASLFRRTRDLPDANGGPGAPGGCNNSLCELVGDASDPFVACRRVH